MVMEKLFLSSKLIAFSPLFFFATVVTSLSAIRLMVGRVCKIVLKKKSYPTQPKNSNFTSNSKQNFTRDAYLQIHLNMYWLIWGSWGYLSEAEYAKQRMVKPSLECRQYHMLALVLVQTNKHLDFSRKIYNDIFAEVIPESVVNTEVFFYTILGFSLPQLYKLGQARPCQVGFDFVSGHFCPP